MDAPDAEVEEQTEFRFDQLSDQAKARARETARGWMDHFTWWEHTFDDATRMAALLGIEIDSGTRGGDSIWFQLHVQGAGASFDGSYRFAPGAVEKITAECGGQDQELICIAAGLTELQVTARLKYGATFTTTVSTGSRSSHSSSMLTEDTAFSGVPPPNDDGYDAVIEEADTKLQTLMRAFADWIYHQLEAGYEHLTSDEGLEAQLDGRLFDVDGSII